MSADRIHPNNIVRVVRALEVYALTGTPMSELQQQWQPEKQRYPFVAFCLTMQRARLYRRIEQRVDVMLANGLIAEVEALLAAGYSRDTVALQSFGYRELIAYLDGGVYIYRSRLPTQTEHPSFRQTATHVVPQRHPS